MSPRSQLHAFLHRLESRLRLSVWARGAAIVMAAALVTTLAAVLVLNALAFTHTSVANARVLLTVLLIFATGLGLLAPLLQLSRRKAAGRLETRFPQFQQRLSTFLERDAEREPFLELLAADTLEKAAEHGAGPESVASQRGVLAGFGVSLASFVALLWMILAGPGFLGYGAGLLWLGPRPGVVPLYDLKVTPGNATIRRNADEQVTALPRGYLPAAVQLLARFQSGSKWETIPMQPLPNGSGYGFVFSALPENVDYYVIAGKMTSPHFSLRVADLPAVTNINVTYHFPTWTGLPNQVDPHGGDLRAVMGTQAALVISTDKPLSQGSLTLSDGTQIALTGGANNQYRALVPLNKDGLYHIASMDQGEPARLSDDYLIEARKPTPPVVTLDRPGRDYHANPIEEVTLGVQAHDEYGLTGFELHYSVNGGPQKDVDLLPAKSVKDAKGSTLLSLEDFKMVPGDVISYYASAKDGNASTDSDMMFVQADPFERDFSQSQQSGGGGGGNQGNQATQISQREKEIIASTLKQESGQTFPQQAAEQGKFLSGVQGTLRDQATSLAGRMDSRELDQENQEFSDFEKDMTAAADAMSPAVARLQQQNWKAALPDEEKALQNLLRAEATFRQIEVAIGARGGGGGGQSSAARDLASLFDLELDTEKNQYETQQTASSSASAQDQKAQDIDDTLKKLDDLAQRQDALAQQQQSSSTPTAEERWQQEMLQREAQQLQQEMQQLAQNQTGQQSQAGQQSQSGQQSQPGQQSQSGQRGQPGQAGSAQGGSQGSAPANAQQAAQQALQQLQQALQAMQRAQQNGQGSAAAAAEARAAANQLRAATNALGNLQQLQASGQLAAMAQQADAMTQQEQQQAQQIKQLEQASASTDNSSAISKLTDSRQQLTDDLEQLTGQMRNAHDELASTQQAAAQKLQNALQGMDDSDLATLLQRTSDWLRQGNDPNYSGTEGDIAKGLQQLDQQLHQAQQALRQGQGQAGADALSQLEQLRQQLAQLGNQPGRGQTQAGRQGQSQTSPRGQQYQAGQLSRNGQPGQPGQQGQQLARSGQQGQQGQQGQKPGQQGQGEGQRGQQGGQNGQAGQRGGQPGGQGDRNANGQPTGAVAQAGPTTIGPGNRAADRQFNPDGTPVIGGQRGGGNNGAYWVDTGNNSDQGTAATPNTNPAPGDAERAIQQTLSQLHSELAQQKDPAAIKQLQDLIAMTQQLDPSRFPGNPAMLDELHQRVLSEVDSLELELRRQDNAAQNAGDVRSTRPQVVPPDYRDAVDEYFRRLSGATDQTAPNAGNGAPGGNR